MYVYKHLAKKRRLRSLLMHDIDTLCQLMWQQIRMKYMVSRKYTVLLQRFISEKRKVAKSKNRNKVREDRSRKAKMRYSQSFGNKARFGYVFIRTTRWAQMMKITGAQSRPILDGRSR